MEQHSQEPESGLWAVAVAMLAFAAFLLWANLQNVSLSLILS